MGLYIALTEGVKNLTSLKTLDLSFNQIGHGGAAKLSEEKKLLSSLENLNLISNKIRDEGMSKIHRALKTGWTRPDLIC